MVVDYPRSNTPRRPLLLLRPFLWNNTNSYLYFYLSSLRFLLIRCFGAQITCNTLNKLVPCKKTTIHIKSNNKDGLGLCGQSLERTYMLRRSYLLEAGLSVLRLGVVRRKACGGGRVLPRQREAGARRIQRPRRRDGHRRRAGRRRRAAQAGPRAPRRALALRTLRTQHAPVPRRAPAHTVKISTPAPTPARTRPAAAATVQRIHIQV